MLVECSNYPVIFPEAYEVPYLPFIRTSESVDLDDNDFNKIADNYGSAREVGLCTCLTFQFRLSTKNDLFGGWNAFSMVCGTGSGYSSKDSKTTVTMSLGLRKLKLDAFIYSKMFLGTPRMTTIINHL